MKTNRTLTALTALTLLAAAPAIAQQEHQHGQQEGQQMQMHGMMGHGMPMMSMQQPGPAELLRAADHLGLTESQRTALSDLAERHGADQATHREAAQSAQATAEELFGAEPRDWAAYEQALADAATHQVKARVAQARASSEAMALLTSEQVATLHQGMAMMYSMMPNAMQGMRGMMDEGGMCPMMTGAGSMEMEEQQLESRRGIRRPWRSPPWRRNVG